MSDTKTLAGQVAVVTGATRGIGRAIALDLGRQGATVIGTATSEDGAGKISAFLAAEGRHREEPAGLRRADPGAPPRELGLLPRRARPDPRRGEAGSARSGPLLTFRRLASLVLVAAFAAGPASAAPPDETLEEGIARARLGAREGAEDPFARFRGPGLSSLRAFAAGAVIDAERGSIRLLEPAVV